MHSPTDSEYSVVDDTTYKTVFDALSRIHDTMHGTQELDLPRICAIGDQSSGKSSLLATLTGVDFPTNASLCTKVPIVVECRRAEAEAYKVRAAPGEAFKAVAKDAVADALRDAQDALVALAGDDAKVTSEEVTVHVSGPDLENFGIVDLPGIIHNGPGADATRALIEHYIAPPQTLVLLLTVAEQDEELAKCLELAKKYDPSGARTLRVLSKFDSFGSTEARTRATELVCGTATDALGAHAVVCRRRGNARYNADHERHALTEATRSAKGKIPDGRAGAQALKERLPAIFAKLIQTNIPMLKATAAERIATSHEMLRRLGDAPLSAMQMISEAQRVLLLPTHRFSEALTPLIDQFREEVHATDARVTLDWVDGAYKHDAFEPPFFQSKTTFERCMGEVEEWWAEPARRLADGVRAALAVSLDPLAYETVGVSQRLIGALKEAWKEASQDMLEALDHEVHRELARAAEFGTTNHYLSDKYAEAQILPNSLIDKLAERAFPGHVLCTIDSRGAFKETLKEARDGIIRDDKRASVRENAVKHVYRAVHATWSVEKKSVTDNVLKVVRDEVVKAREQWVQKTLLVDAAIVKAAVEDDDVADKRAGCHECIGRMERVLEEIALIERAE
jgi:hypothetical protein